MERKTVVRSVLESFTLLVLVTQVNSVRWHRGSVCEDRKHDRRETMLFVERSAAKMERKTVVRSVLEGFTLLLK